MNGIAGNRHRTKRQLLLTLFDSLNDILYEYRYPRSGPLRCLAVLVGDTPIPGKIRRFVYEAYAYLRTRLAAWLSTHAQPESAPVRCCQHWLTLFYKDIMPKQHSETYRDIVRNP